MRVLSFLLVGLLPLFAQQKKAKVPCPVGYRVVELSFRGKNCEPHRFKVCLWYPSSGEEKEIDYGGGWARGRVVLEGPVAEGRHPIAVLSHGFGGSALGWVYIVRELVKRGFVVAAPDHSDSINVVRIGKGVNRRELLNLLREALSIARQGKGFDHKRFEYRRLELRTLVDWLRKQNSDDEKSPFFCRLDTDKLLLMGHSLGSYTVGAVVGLYEKEPPLRAKAVVLLSGGIFMWDPKGFNRIKIPLLMVWGEAERSERRRWGLTDQCEVSLACLRNSGGVKYGVEIAGARHLDFAYKLNSQKAIYRTISHYVISFVDRHILGREDAEATLRTPTENVTLLYPLPRPQFEVEKRLNLAYGNHILQKIDLYIPKGAKKFPSVLVFHGGGWRAGSRKMFGRMCEELARRGIGAATCGYRLAPEFKYPAFMEDAAAAVALARKEFAKAGGDLRRLFLTGHSAGGHIAALLVTNPKFLSKCKLKTSDIAGSAPVSGVYHIVRNRLILKAFGDDPKVWQDASPADNLKGTTPPPFLIIFGEREFLLALTATTFEEALRRVGISVQGVWIPGKSHAGTARDMLNPRSEIFLRLVTFFLKHKTVKVTPLKPPSYEPRR